MVNSLQAERKIVQLCWGGFLAKTTSWSSLPFWIRYWGQIYQLHSHRRFWKWNWNSQVGKPQAWYAEIQDYLLPPYGSLGPMDHDPHGSQSTGKGSHHWSMLWISGRPVAKYDPSRGLAIQDDPWVAQWVTQLWISGNIVKRITCKLYVLKINQIIRATKKWFGRLSFPPWVVRWATHGFGLSTALTWLIDHVDIHWKISRCIPRTQVVSSWWVPFEF